MAARPPMPVDESSRLARLRDLVVLDSAPEPLFDSIAQLASEVCGVPIALLSLVDAERQWFKANVGLPGINETPRDVAFCAHAIMRDAVMEVPDATADPRFADNTLVTGAPDIRFYAGAPLALPSGERVGTLCVIDREARHLTDAQTRMLASLAAFTTQALVMRRELIERSLSVRSEYEVALAESEARHRALVEDQAELVSLSRPDGELVYVNPAYARHFESTPQQMVGTSLFDYVDPADRASVRGLLAEVFEHGQVRTGENRMVDPDGTEHWIAWTNSRQHDAQGNTLLHSVGRDVTVRKQAEQALAESERFVRLVTDGLPLRIAYVDSERRYQFINLAHSKRFGLPREQIIGRRRSELLKQPLDPDVGSRVDEALAGHAQRFEFEEEIDGKLRRIESQLIPDVAPTGEVRGFFATGIDITERSAAERTLRELTTIFDNTPDFVVQSDDHGMLTYMNPAARAVTGLTPDEPVAHRSFSEFNPPATMQLFATTILPAMHRSGLWLGEATVYGGSGHEIPVSYMAIAHRDTEGRIDRYSAVMRDISAEREAKQQLLQQTATLRSVTEAIPALVAVVGRDERYRFINSSFERWCGAKRDGVVGRTMAEVLGRTEYERSRPWLQRVLSGETVSFEKAYTGHGAIKHMAVSYVPLWLETGMVDGFVGVAQDITQHRQEEVRLLQLSQRDPLTGLLNRAGFEEFLDRQMKQGGGSALALLYIDLDHFKPVNDKHGHPAGDAVLRMFGERMLSLVRPTDAVARLGGDEFAVVLAGVREEGNARAVADKIVAAAHAPFTVGTLQLSIGASVGVAFGADPHQGWRELLARADALVYKAKAAGRGRQAS